MKYLLILFSIGSMWSQEHSSESGEKLEKLYDSETGKLIENKVPLDSVALPFKSNVNSYSKDISYKDLSKTQKKIYNQNRIRLSEAIGSDLPYFYTLRDNFWSAYINKGLFKKERLNQTEFFEITGYPERVKIMKHNRKLGLRCALIYPIFLLTFQPINLSLPPEDAVHVIFITFFGGGGFLLYDYFTKYVDGTSFDDARLIAKEYNQDLMVKIYNENN